MAYLSSYLGGGSLYPRRSQTRTSRRNYGTPYVYPRASQPYSVPRRGVSGVESSSPFGGQDLASALLQQKMVSQASAPSNQFDSSYNYDPILAKIQALGSQSVANATTNAAQLRKDALISSGQYQTGQALGFDANTISAAQQNPESEYAQLQKEFQVRQKQLEEAMSAQNLLYSGEYTNNLSLLNQGRASAEGAIGSNLRNLLSGIDTGLLGSQETARQATLDAATQAALARHYKELGYGGGSYSGGIGFDPGALESLQAAGYSADDVAAAAQAYQTSHGYSGINAVKQEGTITYQNGVPGVMIKYIDANGGSTTEWTPLPDQNAPDVAAQQNPVGINVVTGEPDPTIRSSGGVAPSPSLMQSLALGTGGRSYAV